VLHMAASVLNKCVEGVSVTLLGFIHYRFFRV
jgi:hypothetical protein